MLPANTALAGFADLDVTQLWQVLQRELAQSGIPEAAEAARAFPQIFEAQTEIPWTPLLASLGGEIGVVLTLDDTRKISFPAGQGGQIEMPRPALLVAVKVTNDLLYDRISAKFQVNPKSATSEEAGLKICSMPMPVPLPISLEPTVASSGDYFYFATSPDLVRTVQAVRQGKSPSLKASRTFQDLAKYLPSEGNQFTFVSGKLGQTIREVQRQAMQASGMPEEGRALLQRLFGAGQSAGSLSIGAHTSTGWRTTSVGNQDSASAVLLAPVGVVAVGAGLLLPAFAKAKSSAQSIGSVNQVKQLGLAARLYAGDHKDKFPNGQTWGDDLKEYVGNTKVYKAPNDSGPGQCSYAYNEKLSGRDVSKVDPQTVLFFESDGGWNQSGGPDLLLAQPRSAEAYVIGLADGSVQQIAAPRLRSLRWEP